MGKRKGKKKGSTMIVLLGMAMVMVMLSATLASALTFTTQNNEVEKRDDDLLYAAEGGLEFGIEEYKKNTTVSTALQNLTPTSAPYIIKNFNNFSSTVNNVEVKGVKKTDSEIQIISTAKTGVKKRSVQVSIKKVPKKRRLYEYSILAEKVDITTKSGPKGADVIEGKLGNKSTDFKLEIWTEDGKLPDGRDKYKIANSDFKIINDTLEFNIGTGKDAMLPRQSVINIEMGKASSAGADLTTALTSKITPTGGIYKQRINLTGIPFDLFIINADELNIYNRDNEIAGDDPGILIKDTIIICTGKVNVVDYRSQMPIYINKYPNGSSAWSKYRMETFRSTIISKSFEGYIRELPNYYASMRDDGFGLLRNEADANYIDSIVEMYIDGWNSSASSTTETTWNLDSEIVYK